MLARATAFRHQASMVLNADPLPIDDVLPELLSALSRAHAAVLVAPPGAGKSTRVPLALREASWARQGRILMLEPRRLAARATARRMASLLGEEVGHSIGYRVRFESRVSSATRIEVLTEGIFTRMLQEDPALAGVSVVIFDEFHERSLDADLGLALAIEARILREDLRILVMSATIDAARIAKLLDDAPVLVSEGRAFPVETRYVDRDPMARLELQAADVAAAAVKAERGSALVFLPGQAEIRRTAEHLEGRLPMEVEVIPLYGQLTAAEQDRALKPAPPGRRKVVLATAIAETSLTIEGVRIVVDSGYARKPAYDPATGLTTLVTTRVSRAAADQRRGRAGRTEPGVCYRLWNEGQTAALAPFDMPEILQTDLAGFALDLANWGVTDPAQLALLDQPPKAAWREAVTLLHSLHALDENGRITAEGKALAKLPLHPRLAHMVHAAAQDGDLLTAAELAVLVTERGLGGDDVDLAERWRRFRHDRAPRAEDARLMARRWAQAAGGENRVPAETVGIGRHLARAYPDRIAQNAGAAAGQRSGGDAIRFRMANGRSAFLDSVEPVSRSAFLVVTDVTGTAASGRIRGCVALARADLEELFAADIREEVTLSFDSASQSVRARRRRTFGALRLDEAPAPIADPAAAAELLAAAIAERGVGILPWSKEQRALRARAHYLATTLGAPWPDLSDQALAANGAAWLAPYIAGRTSLAEITAADLAAALDAMLPYPQRAELDRLLPSHFSAPSGSHIPIDYETENGPVLAARVQELFGLDRHPAVADGRVPLRVVLLSPAHRPIQTTRDLPGFWRGSWRDVAKELKGRYPRHFWPDDPVTAQATARAKPKGG
ncbi:ATP-dependent helicase HrpB [Rhodoligotrophos defluvii]|uniref:ATP-dependent helicase HrpB n=1 Tax=Rhodoligotrophos defluvii TaxID=2561934 RepID=UPI001EF05D2E|nr:ATP-dependent helicase HrpB [Rhodoligotrophos defluvii]